MGDKYDNKHYCIKCGASNIIKVEGIEAGVVSEVRTTCSACRHKDYWSFGYFESRADERTQK